MEDSSEYDPLFQSSGSNLIHGLRIWISAESTGINEYSYFYLCQLSYRYSCNDNSCCVRSETMTHSKFEEFVTMKPLIEKPTKRAYLKVQKVKCVAGNSSLIYVIVQKIVETSVEQCEEMYKVIITFFSMLQFMEQNSKILNLTQIAWFSKNNRLILSSTQMNRKETIKIPVWNLIEIVSEFRKSVSSSLVHMYGNAFVAFRTPM